MLQTCVSIFFIREARRCEFYRCVAPRFCCLHLKESCFYSEAITWWYGQHFRNLFLTFVIVSLKQLFLHQLCYYKESLCWSTPKIQILKYLSTVFDEPSLLWTLKLFNLELCSGSSFHFLWNYTFYASSLIFIWSF